MRLPVLRAALAASAATSALLLTAACAGSTAPEPPIVTTESVDPGANDAAAYSDGTYRAEGTYANPGGQSSITVSLTLKDDVVTDLSLKPGATGTSLQYQNKFIGGAPDRVIGKSLNDVKVSKVSGSSLTSDGFNQALEEIKADAAV